MANEPKWNGKHADIDDNIDLLIPVGLLGPLVITIWDCDDPFLLVFTDETILTKAVNYIVPKMGLPVPDKIEKIRPNERQKFLEGVWKENVRVMVDPDLSDEHTRWHEIMPQEEAVKYGADYN